mmetsp:Transcript_6569/g.16263  ORF Transcript_6569/g.16263 Transcript_6569/m.16263 type:complete len:501 (-) Transcript_6569:164-1666(-)
MGHAPPSSPRLASRAIPHADKVGAGALERVPREGDLAGGAVEVEDGAVVRVLVGHDQPLPALVELEVAGRLAARVENACEGDEAGRARVAVYAVDGDRVVAAVGGEHEVAARVDRHAAARVELTREGGGERGDGLHQAERGLARAEQLGAQRRRGAREEAVDLSRDLGVVLEDGHLRGELVDDVADGPPLVEAHVARAEREAVHLDAGEHLAARRDHARLLVEVQLADHVHPQVGHECHAAAARLKHDRVRVRVALPLRLRRRVVARVVDVVLRARLHRAALLRVVRGHDAAQPAVRLHADRADRRVPVVDQQHAAAAVVDGEEARRGAARAHGRAELAQRAGLAVEREGDHLPLLLDALGARVDHVELGVAARKRRIVDSALACDREQREAAVGDVQAVGAHGACRLRAARPVREVAELRVARDDHDRAEGVRRWHVAVRRCEHEAHLQLLLQLLVAQIGVLSVVEQHLVQATPVAVPTDVLGHGFGRVQPWQLGDEAG